MIFALCEGTGSKILEEIQKILNGILIEFQCNIPWRQFFKIPDFTATPAVFAQNFKLLSLTVKKIIQILKAQSLFIFYTGTSVGRNESLFWLPFAEKFLYVNAIAIQALDEIGISSKML